MSDIPNSGRSNFDRMVSGISDDERKDLLSRVQKGQDDELFPDDRRELKDSLKSTLNIRFRQEGFFVRIWLKLKAAFLGMPLEDVYNTTMVSGIARDIERNFPGYINYHRSCLIAPFYDKLVQIKEIQEYFRPCMDYYSQNTSRFYFFLGSIVMNESTKKAIADSDPYQYPFTKNLTKESRVLLLQKMDDVLDNLPEYPRAQMYADVKTVEWLSAFCKLYLDDLIASFSGNEKDCDFSMARADFSQFARIMSCCNPCDTDTIQALFQFYQQGNPSVVQGEDAAIDFATHGENELALLTTFSQGMPVKDIAKVVFNNALFDCGIFSGGEDWYMRYKAQWKTNFDSRWASWMKDYNKYRLRIKLNSYFNTAILPSFPVRPWENLWGDLHFNYEITIGFVWFFFKDLIPQYSDVLKILMLEGDFAIKENAALYTDMIHSINQVSSMLDALKLDLSEKGETGQEFYKIIEKQETRKTGRENAQGLLDDVYKRCSAIVDQFGTICRTLKCIFDAVINGMETDEFGPITNLMKIHGRENKNYRERLSLTAAVFEHAYEVLQEAEAIDSSGV